jgi:hypothetical protein
MRVIPGIGTAIAEGDVQMDAELPALFLGGKDYLPLFCSLTSSFRGDRLIYFNASKAPEAPGCRLVRYETPVRTNWHYECADRIVTGALEPAVGLAR